MNAIEILQTIEKYNLSVRRIPDEVISKWIAYNIEDGKKYEVNKLGRMCSVERRVPTHKGYYMVKPVRDTGSEVRWNAKTDFLSDTLEGSIQLFLSSLETSDIEYYGEVIKKKWYLYLIHSKLGGAYREVQADITDEGFAIPCDGVVCTVTAPTFLNDYGDYFISEFPVLDPINAWLERLKDND